jgi:hypothetical protein
VVRRQGAEASAACRPCCDSKVPRGQRRRFSCARGGSTHARPPLLEPVATRTLRRSCPRKIGRVLAQLQLLRQVCVPQALCELPSYAIMVRSQCRTTPDSGIQEEWSYRLGTESLAPFGLPGLRFIEVVFSPHPLPPGKPAVGVSFSFSLPLAVPCFRPLQKSLGIKQCKALQRIGPKSKPPRPPQPRDRHQLVVHSASAVRFRHGRDTVHILTPPSTVRGISKRGPGPRSKLLVLCELFGRPERLGGLDLSGPGCELHPLQQRASGSADVRVPTWAPLAYSGLPHPTPGAGSGARTTKISMGKCTGRLSVGRWERVCDLQGSRQ